MNCHSGSWFYLLALVSSFSNSSQFQNIRNTFNCTDIAWKENNKAVMFFFYKE